MLTSWIVLRCVTFKAANVNSVLIILVTIFFLYYCFALFDFQCKNESKKRGERKEGWEVKVMKKKKHASI